ncbi:MAG: alpha/beta hydrolase [Deltaproteobacteria bacterium]|jgi:pimeloyl-ACP methyl ester carboxylesterase|nr:alpha/beta hydrolase [Deltaproteobacteria bacterium]
MSEPKMIKAKGDGVKIQVAVWEGKGKPILCVHGLTANCRCWDLLASSLSPRHKVLAMDLRGRGLSDSPPSGYSVETHCKDILALMDDQGLERPVLMGHSLGAFISLVFAAKYPRRLDRLILVDGGGKLSEAQMTKVFAGIKPSLDRLGKIFPDFESYLALLKQAPFLQPWNSFFETYFRYEVEDVEGGVRSRVHPKHIEEEAGNLKKMDSSQFYKKVMTPTLILRATKGMLSEDDLVLPADVAERMVREIPNAKKVDVEGSNHYSILFQPNPMRDKVLLGFLE